MKIPNKRDILKPLAVPHFRIIAECDGNRLAQALDWMQAIIEGILHDTQKDHEEAVIINRALFPATIGYYFDTLLDQLGGR